MILPDAGVLAGAFRSDADNHAQLKAWLEEVVNGSSAYGIAPSVLAKVVRVCTDPRVFVRPSTPSDVFEFTRVLLEQPQATMIVPGARHWPIFESLCREAVASGALVRKAWFAALAIESGCEWISTDPDYECFRALRRRAPG